MLSYIHDFQQWFLLKATEPLEKPTLQLPTPVDGMLARLYFVQLLRLFSQQRFKRDSIVLFG